MTPLLTNELAKDPIQQFVKWFREAEQANIPLPNAMNLATSSCQGRASARMVLLKGVDEHGFIFFTNYESRKAQDLKSNPYAALVFYWLPLSRQVRVEGAVERLGPRESDEYFASRPRGHQIEAHASPQSQIIKDRASLKNLFKDTANKYDGKLVPRPQQWGGYRVIPGLVEFWQEGENRLHDRLCYRRENGGPWVIERLAP